ncbi:flagellar basal body-associated FliL family protein [Azospirillum sp. YIM B02556]|uniref:Flagellar protein FliL n=1 Tax=Azospirillum endophyticum TaxID=2800326 RepID=A0ABS1F9C1_9PROT|nr:flagellar basal body-associated FliL family protein [Azospirillum endophyticum]MBK1840023.1 flagellar basal body-associated FliL family protein [Azospirillum endophyticum]
MSKSSMSAGSERNTLPSFDGTGNRIVLALLGLMIAFAGAGAGGALLLRPAPAQGAYAPPRIAAASAPAVYAALPTLTVTLNDGRRLQELRLRAVLEFDPATPLETVTPHLPHIADAISRRLLEVDPAELRGAEGPAYIKDALRYVANKTMRPLKLRQVLIQDMLLR